MTVAKGIINSDEKIKEERKYINKYIMKERGNNEKYKRHTHGVIDKVQVKREEVKYAARRCSWEF